MIYILHMELRTIMPMIILRFKIESLMSKRPTAEAFPYAFICISICILVTPPCTTTELITLKRVGSGVADNAEAVRFLVAARGDLNLKCRPGSWFLKTGLGFGVRFRVQGLGCRASDSLYV